MNDVILCYALVIGLAIPLGLYMAHSLGDGRKAPLESFFLPIESGIYRLAGVDAQRTMTWQTYAWAVAKLHIVLVLLAWGVFMAQGWLPLNPDRIPGMSWDTALHTAVSFATNTNQQHYSGQAQLSYMSQTFAIVTLQFITPATGLAVLLAIARVLLKKPSSTTASDVKGAVVDVGNYYRDLMRTLVRVMLPVATLVALLLTWQGVPGTYQGAQTVQPLDSTVTTTQHIPLGPVASMVAIKQLGTNGGGWYGPNSSVPLENPTPLSNVIETVSLLLFPVALLVAIGVMTGRRRLMMGIGAVMLAFSLASTTAMIVSEKMPNAAFEGLAIAGSPNMEGKEVRFGPEMSALWASWTTQTSNGSVNAMHDSFNPLGGAVTLMDMFVNVTFGGIGVGLIGYLLYLMLAAFVGSLMIGRAPELLGKPLETREMRWISLAILAQPLIILGLTALTVAFPALAGTSNPAFHGLSQVLYEYTSAFANNGSGFEGLGDGTPWWNLTCVIALLVGRFLPMLAPLAVAAWLAGKRTAPAGRGSLDMDSGAFVGLTAGVIVIINLLGFLPVLVLGPVAEQLTLGL
ncbi:potassium-transporting ATPase subunit KdpA [Kushneria phosphatilytica]|uniref:Potassium-transporting ATPase potassium-binding subunit n=2 Tax=Kushneria phosphatilytica TaxID=657387 RepID=A0A1S1NZA8_9GAMM|nr:potassium-transporting ATPase subunit KdpA [Kushneria phosphatilytica]OHV13103.1 potassium-transporting ATPase subunit KdpA [Kushneria phosphatilytica]QEL12745.1 potassium-transporting ATPase subunit KdpA [Kushneria phosphatilytica]